MFDRKNGVQAVCSDFLNNYNYLKMDEMVTEQINMKLYIIGNGFDLNHGLPTSYYNYRDYLRINAPQIATNYESCQNIQAAELNKNTRWNDVENGLGLYYEDAFVDMGENYYPNMNSERTPGWEDIKLETDNRFSFLKTFTKDYLYNWIQEIETYMQGISQKYNLNSTDAYLTFNYTKTLELIYKIPDIRVYHIHGNIDFPQSIQFGNPNNKPEEIKNDLEKQYWNNEFYSVVYEPAIGAMFEYANNAYKNVIGNIHGLDLFIKRCVGINEVIIMGHALLGIDDIYYEKVIVPNFSNCLWTFYVHTTEDEDKTSLFLSKYHLNKYQILKW